MKSALRGGGVPSKADIVSNLSKGGCVNLQIRGEEGVKKSENFADVIYGSPLRDISCMHMLLQRLPGGLASVASVMSARPPHSVQTAAED